MKKINEGGKEFQNHLNPMKMSWKGNGYTLCLWKYSKPCNGPIINIQFNGKLKSFMKEQEKLPLGTSGLGNL